MFMMMPQGSVKDSKKGRELKMPIMTEGFKKAIKKLSSREREIIKLRYGFTYIKGGGVIFYHRDEIAKMFKMSEDRVRHIEEKAEKKLKDIGFGDKNTWWLNGILDS